MAQALSRGEGLAPEKAIGYHKETGGYHHPWELQAATVTATASLDYSCPRTHARTITTSSLQEMVCCWRAAVAVVSGQLTPPSILDVSPTNRAARNAQKDAETHRKHRQG